MWLLRIIVAIGGAGLAASIWWAMGADTRGLGPVLVEMFSKPWTVVTLIDLYLGFLLAAVVICLFEKSWFSRFFWAVPIFFLGNVWLAVWFVIRLPELTRRLRGH